MPTVVKNGRGLVTRGSGHMPTVHANSGGMCPMLTIHINGRR
jgi:hypothetical protein